MIGIVAIVFAIWLWSQTFVTHDILSGLCVIGGLLALLKGAISTSFD
jgi:hypothetical protein